MNRLLLGLLAIAVVGCSSPTEPTLESREVHVTHPAGTDGLDYLTLGALGPFTSCTWVRTIVRTDGDGLVTSTYHCSRPCPGA